MCLHRECAGKAPPYDHPALQSTVGRRIEQGCFRKHNSDPMDQARGGRVNSPLRILEPVTQRLTEMLTASAPPCPRVTGGQRWGQARPLQAQSGDKGDSRSSWGCPGPAQVREGLARQGFPCELEPKTRGPAPHIQGLRKRPPFLQCLVQMPGKQRSERAGGRGLGFSRHSTCSTSHLLDLTSPWHPMPKSFPGAFDLARQPLAVWSSSPLPPSHKEAAGSHTHHNKLPSQQEASAGS